MHGFFFFFLAWIFWGWKSMHSFKKKLHHLENDITNKTDADIKNHIFKVKQTNQIQHSSQQPKIYDIKTSRQSEIQYYLINEVICQTNKPRKSLKYKTGDKKDNSRQFLSASLSHDCANNQKVHFHTY